MYIIRVEKDKGCEGGLSVCVCVNVYIIYDSYSRSRLVFQSRKPYYAKRALMAVHFFFFFLQRPSTMRSKNLARVFRQDFRCLHETVEVSTAT